MTNGYEGERSESDSRIRRARRLKILKRSFGAASAVIIITAIIFIFVRYAGRSDSKPGQIIQDQGRDHVALGTAFEYNSNPPTSGPHTANNAEWGVYAEEIPDQILIHNLEHGGIWISYQSGIDSAVVAKLEAVAKEFGRKVIMAPRSANDSDIALAAWNHLDKFSASEFSEERVRAFIKAYRNKGPEFVP